jgi:hypothetical protein
MLIKNVQRTPRRRDVWTGSLHSGLSLCAFTVLFLLVGITIIVASQQKGDKNILTATQSLLSAKVPSATGSSASSKQGEKPQSGWLYILDSNNFERESQVSLLDPEQGHIVKTFKAGYAPDMALSPDGRRLYITSTKNSPGGDKQQGVLEVIDTTSEAILQTVKDPDRWISTSPWYPPFMALSPDGRWLYILKAHGYFSYVATFDTVKGRFLIDKTPLYNCTTAQLLPLPEGRRLNIIGAYPNNYDGIKKVLFLHLTESRAAVSTQGKREDIPELDLQLQEEKEWPKVTEEYAKRSLAFGFLSTDNRSPTVVIGGGQFFKIDSQNRKILQTEVIDRQGRKFTSNVAGINTPNSDDWMAGRWIGYQYPALSPDGRKLYVGIGRLIHLHDGVDSFDQVAVLDSRTLRLLKTITPRYAFYSLAMSGDGSRLYAISPEQACLMVMDAATGREIKVIYDVGETPVRAIVAP